MMSEDSKVPLIMQEYPGLKEIPRVDLAKTPVPVQRLKGLEEELGHEGIWIKREDLSHDVYGGNKARKFEYQLADAIEKGKKKIMTFGGLGSNQTLANAVYCREFEDQGLEAVSFVYDQILTEHVRYNLKLDHFYGSEIIHKHSLAGTVLSMLWYYITHKDTYLIWAGTSTPLGTIGFVDAIFELTEQIKNGDLEEPDYIFVPDGSTGTAAGITLGCELAGLKTHVYGVMVTDELIASKNRVLGLANRTYKLLRKHDKSIPSIKKSQLAERLTILTDFRGDAYGRPTEEGFEAKELLAECDNIQLDLTYTGKTCSAMIAYIREKKERIKDKKFLFWLTLNTVDHHEEAESVDWHDLPDNLHQYFDGTVPLQEQCVQARNCLDDVT